MGHKLAENQMMVTGLQLMLTAAQGNTNVQNIPADFAGKIILYRGLSTDDLAEADQKIRDAGLDVAYFTRIHEQFQRMIESLNGRSASDAYSLFEQVMGSYGKFYR